MTGSLLEEIRRWLRPPSVAADHPVAAEVAEQRAPSAFVVDDEEGICNVVSVVLASLGIKTQSFTTADAAIAALQNRPPGIIFLDIALKKSDAVDVIRSLGAMRYGGIVQLMSGNGLPLLNDVRRIGERHGVHMCSPLTKPFRAEAIRQIIQTANLNHQPAGKISLAFCLSSVRKAAAYSDSP
jgi:DNA-binding NtrC family response regulator